MTFKKRDELILCWTAEQIRERLNQLHAEFAFSNDSERSYRALEIEEFEAALDAVRQ